MNRLLVTTTVAVTFGAFATFASAMTDSEYASQKLRLEDEFSHKFVICVEPDSFFERLRCESEIRTQRNNALKALKQNYEKNRGK